LNSKEWSEYWSRPYFRYEQHQQWFWDNVYPFLKQPILDIGCGPASMWKGQDYEVIGFDYSQTAIQEAQKNYPKGKFFVSSIEDYSPTDKFSTVVSCGVVHYFYPDKLKIVRDAHVNSAQNRIIISLNTPVDLNLFADWGNLVHAVFKDKVGWVLVFDRV
jgi:SAM-dependent methyltransferase